MGWLVSKECVCGHSENPKYEEQHCERLDQNYPTYKGKCSSIFEENDYGAWSYELEAQDSNEMPKGREATTGTWFPFPLYHQRLQSVHVFSLTPLC